MRRWLKGLLTGVATAATGVLLIVTPFGAGFEQNIGLSTLFKLRGPLLAPDTVMVVAIDDQTGSQLGISKLPREWSRSVHARLVENLTRQGASVIVFDMDFQLPKQPQDDAIFVRAVADANRVILVEKLDGKRQPLINSLGKQTGSVWIEQLAKPFPELAAVARGLAPFPLPKVQVAIHQFWAFKNTVDAPTMPAIALQSHFLSSYPHLLTLIQKAGFTPPQPPLTTLTKADELLMLMRQLRSLFVKTPGLGATLQAMLANDASLNFSATQIAQLKALIGLYQGEDQRLLNFYGPPGSITTVPYHVAANQTLPNLAGKVVFVGFSDLYDPGQPDRFVTVFSNDDGVDLSGVEIAATAFGNLLTHRTLSMPDTVSEILIVLFFGGTVGLLAYMLPAIIGVPFAIAWASGYAAFTYKAFIDADTWFPLATPLLVQLPLALFIGLLGQYFWERRKTSLATQAMSFYVPEDLARDFSKNMDQSIFNRVRYCVCFASDMAGFTTISEQLAPKELAAFLNEYFEVLSGPLKRHGVDVIEFRADGVMCAWTAEQPEPVQHRKALLAGLEAIDAIALFKQRHAELKHSLRIGIEVGMAYVGHAGGGGHFVYSIVGDCANTAARIEGLNKQLGTQMLVSQAAIEGAAEGLLYRFLGDFRFVGKTEALPVVEVIALAETASLAQQLLCERFTEAMETLRQEQWQQAGEQFQAILNDYPDDGPSRFHLARCLRYGELPKGESPWVVHLNMK